ncbi:MAG: hypothetical protein KJ558_01465 [Gammaproteobacteria bacterium]|nr:hypothetical protein [Gammaproteobacteria bacterium]MBU1961853.1 hypothetical protein [Gammaproteobacteria bacterium]
MRVRLLPAHAHLLASLPYRLIHLLGGLVGWWSYASCDGACKAVRFSIYSAYPELKRWERERMVQQTLRENARTLLEMPRLWRQGKGRISERIIGHKGLEILHRAQIYGKGVILALPYVGNWEVVTGYLSTLNARLLIGETFPIEGLTGLAILGRGATGATLVPRDGQEEETYLQALRAGALVCLFPDRMPLAGEEALSVPLFRGPVMTSTRLPRLARASGSVVIYAFAERVQGGKGYRIQWILGPQEIYDANPMAAVSAANSGVRLCVKRRPEQYLWGSERLSPGHSA